MIRSNLRNQVIVGACVALLGLAVMPTSQGAWVNANATAVNCELSTEQCSGQAVGEHGGLVFVYGNLQFAGKFDSCEWPRSQIPTETPELPFVVCFTSTQRASWTGCADGVASSRDNIDTAWLHFRGGVC